MTMRCPTQDEIQRFLLVFEALSGFEAEQRFVRGHGVFNKIELPIAEVVVVRDWLQSIALGERMTDGGKE